MSTAPFKTTYRVRNWKEYNQTLVNRGKVSMWIKDDAIKNWVAKKPWRKKNGRPFRYDPKAIETALTLRYALNLTLRAIEGFLVLIFTLFGVALPVPDYTSLCKRGKESPKPTKPKRITDIVIDSTGVKVFGEGEWKVRQHGRSKRRKWRKFHIGIDPKTGEVIAHEATESNVHDGGVGCRLIERIEQPVVAYGDGAYDTKSFYQAVVERGGKVTVPPRRKARVDRAKEPVLRARNDAVLAIRGFGGDDIARSIWKKLTGYHTRSLVETWFSGFKRMLGGVLRSRVTGSQDAQLGCKVKIMNELTRFGMPKSYTI